jgi:hypothetical protein
MRTVIVAEDGKGTVNSLVQYKQAAFPDTGLVRGTNYQVAALCE